MKGAKDGKQELTITIGDVQLCIANAERLLADSTKVSAPTAVALSELALEETLKGWVLYEHRTDKGRDAPHADLAIPGPVRRYLEDNIALLRSIDPRDVFEDHRPKLDALRFVAGFVRVAIAHTPAEEIASSAKRLSTDGTSMSGFIDKSVIDQMTRVLTVVNDDETRRLSDLKEKGFYVDLSERDQIVSPDSRIFPNDKVFALYVQMILGCLKGTVTATVA